MTTVEHAFGANRQRPAPRSDHLEVFDTNADYVRSPRGQDRGLMGSLALLFTNEQTADRLQSKFDTWRKERAERGGLLSRFRAALRADREDRKYRGSLAEISDAILPADTMRNSQNTQTSFDRQDTIELEPVKPNRSSGWITDGLEQPLRTEGTAIAPDQIAYQGEPSDIDPQAGNPFFRPDTPVAPTDRYGVLQLGTDRTPRDDATSELPKIPMQRTPVHDTLQADSPAFGPAEEQSHPEEITQLGNDTLLNLAAAATRRVLGDKPVEAEAAKPTISRTNDILNEPTAPLRLVRTKGHFAQDESLPPEQRGLPAQPSRSHRRAAPENDARTAYERGIRPYSQPKSNENNENLQQAA